MWCGPGSSRALGSDEEEWRSSAECLLFYKGVPWGGGERGLSCMDRCGEGCKVDHGGKNTEWVLVVVWMFMEKLQQTGYDSLGQAQRAKIRYGEATSHSIYKHSM